MTDLYPTCRHLGCRALAVLAFAVWMLWANGLQAATPASLDLSIRQALVARVLPEAMRASLHESAMTPAVVRRIVRRHLDPGLLASVQHLQGTEFRFTPSEGQGEAQVVALTLSYPDARTANRMAARLAVRDGVFQNTKILTAFSRVAVDRQLIVVFTENAGSDELIRLLNALPELVQIRP